MTRRIRRDSSWIKSAGSPNWAQEGFRRSFTEGDFMWEGDSKQFIIPVPKSEARQKLWDVESRLSRTGRDTFQPKVEIIDGPSEP